MTQAQQRKPRPLRVCTKCGVTTRLQGHTCPAAQPHAHPMAQVAVMVADDFRKLLTPKPYVEPVAWVTHCGELLCSTCVQPTFAQRELWLGVLPGAGGKPEPCDLCGAEVST